MILPIEIIQLILVFSEFKEKIKLTGLSKECYDYLKINKINNKNITQEILYQKKYDKLKSLNICDNSNITDIKHLNNTLTYLNISGDECKIDQNAIQGLTKLQILNARDNPKINNVNHLKNTLSILY